VQIRTIAPSDVPAIPERMGDMVFDRMMMRWVKSTDKATNGDEMASYLPSEEGSEDPFEGIESLRDDSRVRDSEAPARDQGEVSPHELSRVDEQSELDEVEREQDEEEMELTSFSTDASRIVEVMTGIDSGEEYTDSEDNPPDEPVNELIPEPASDSEDEMGLQSIERHIEAQLVPLPTSNQHLTPAKESVVPSASATPIKSALKNATPSSVRSGQKYSTPLRSAMHRRSVSFSDGKREGPIRGVGRNFSPTDGPVSQAPSVRSKRIADVMQALENSGTSNPCFVSLLDEV
jgi:protein NUD1